MSRASAVAVALSLALAACGAGVVTPSVEGRAASDGAPCDVGAVTRSEDVTDLPDLTDELWAPHAGTNPTSSAREHAQRAVESSARDDWFSAAKEWRSAYEEGGDLQALWSLAAAREHLDSGDISPDFHLTYAVLHAYRDRSSAVLPPERASEIATKLAKLEEDTVWLGVRCDVAGAVTIDEEPQTITCPARGRVRVTASPRTHILRFASPRCRFASRIDVMPRTAGSVSFRPRS